MKKTVKARKTKINYNTLNLSAKEIGILKQLDKIRNGSYFIIQYYTNCNSKVTAKYRDCNVTKLTTISVRKGIDYQTTKAAIAKKSIVNSANNSSNSQQQKKPWFVHVEDSKVLLKHATKDQYYLALYPNKFGKAETQYFVNGVPKTKEELIAMQIMQPSYWTNKEKSCDFLTLGLDKIYKVSQSSRK